MSTEQATLIEPVNKRRGRKVDPNQDGPIHLRLAARPARNRVQRLVELAASLLQEAETLARDRVFAEQASKMRNLDFSGGIDFYEEVTQFETGLIKMALEQTGGNQAKAAELLHIKPTTLNSKIKLYKIECRP
jgi:DNA-binding protein Fis